MSEDSIKKNLDIINSYFDGMHKLYSDVDYFTTECINAIKEKTAVVKIYGLGFNLAWSLRYTINKMIAYQNMLINTLLYDYWEENKNEVDHFSQMSAELEDFINSNLEPLSIKIKGADSIEKEIPEDEEDEEIKLLIEDNEYLLNLSQDLVTNGPKLLHLIIFYLNHARRILIEIRNIRLNRTENDYALLFEREFKEYLTTDIWNELRDSFISTTISIKYRGNEPSVDQLIQMRDNEFGLMMVSRKELGPFDAYLSDPAKLARHIVNKEIEHNVKNPVIDLFGSLGRMKLIDRWISDIQDETPLMEHFEGLKPNEAITFTERMSEDRLKNLWPKIEEVYNERSAIDLVCLYHVLLYRKCIMCDDFKFFARWINETADKEIISEVNIRQIKMSYWAKEADRIWTIDGFHKWRNSAKADSQYRDYELLCDQINELIK